MVGWLSVIRVAVTAPVLEVVPLADRQMPTLTDDAVAFSVSV